MNIFLFCAMIFTISMGITEAFAQSQVNPNFDLGWKIRIFIDDIRENIVNNINPNWGSQIRLENTIIAQEKLESLLQQGKPVPDDLFQRVHDKFEQTRLAGSQIREELIESVTIIAETNEIRKIVADFQSGNYDKSELQARINALDSVKQKCEKTPLVEDLERDPQNAYNIVQERYCTVLKTYNAESALKILNRQ